jgi:iron complex outermembrane recepter protein
MSEKVFEATVLVLALVSAAGAQAPTTAPGVAGGQLQEVIVTATRRDELLSNVPISVSAYTQDSLDLRGVRDFDDIARLTPGVTIDSNQTNSISIRGIASSGGAGTTGIYVDDTPIQMHALGTSDPADALPKIFDLERVEVLRGPQGTLFGAGSEGGTVRYITPQPSLTKTTAYARTELSYTQGGTPNYEAGFAAGGPLIDDNLGIRASIWYRHDGGWIDRIDPTTLATVDPNTNYDDTIAGHVAALWAVGEHLTVTPSLVFQNRERHDLSSFWPIYSNPGANIYRSADPTGRPEPDALLLPALKIAADLGKAELISVSSYYHRRALDGSGYDGTLFNLGYFQTLGGAYAFPQLTFNNPSVYPLLDQNGVHLPPALQGFQSPAKITNKQDNWTQEIRLQSKEDFLDRISWTTGVFFSLDRTFSQEETITPTANQVFNTLFSGLNGGGICAAFGVPGPDCLPNGDSYFNRIIGYDRQLAGFGEASWRIVDQLKLITGARLSKTSATFNRFGSGAQNGGAGYNTGSEKANPFTPKVGLEYQITPHDLVYATWSKGFRVGGANSPIPASICAADFAYFHITSTPTSFAPDTVKSWEVGLKANIDDRVKIASSIFYIQWNNIQQNVALPFCALNYTANLGNAVSKGFDLQVDIALTRALTLESTFGYDSARYAGDTRPGPGAPTIVAASGDAVVGQSLVPAPPFTATVGLQYDFNVVDYKSYVRVDYEYQSQNHWLTAAEDPRTVQFSSTQQPGGPQIPTSYNPSSQTFVSLRGGTQVGKWKISAFVDNLLDTHVTTDYGITPLDPSNPALLPLYRNYTYRPRTFGMTGIYRF